jgi:Peptidase family M1 domain
MSLSLDPAHRRVSGVEQVRFAPDAPTDRLVFRLWANEPVLRREGAKLTVRAVTAAGRRRRVHLTSPTTLVVALGRKLAVGVPVPATVRWTLRLPRGRPDRIDSARHSVRLGSFYPLLAWEPGRGWVLDTPPRMPAESSTSPTADFDVRVSAPKGLRVLATGTRVSRGRWQAHAVRDFALAAGRFTVASRTIRVPNPVRVTVALQARGAGAVPRTSSPFARAGTARQYLARAAYAVQKLSQLYGPYPWPSFTAVVERDVYPTGGIEYPNLVFLGYRSLLTAVAHETAHQWFYSLVGNNQGRDPWLDEGLATWAQAQVEPGSRAYLRSRRIPAVARKRLGQPIAFWNRHRSAYSAGVYAQGFQALSALGSAARVNCGLQLYVARRAYEIATQPELLQDLDAVIPGAARALRARGARG